MAKQEVFLSVECSSEKGQMGLQAVAMQSWQRNWSKIHGAKEDKLCDCAGFFQQELTVQKRSHEAAA